MRTDYIDPKIMWKIIDRLSYDNQLVMEVCMETGMRVGDVVALPFTALHGQNLDFIAQKTKKAGRAKISVELMRKLIRNSNGEFLFPSDKSKTGHRTRQAVWRDVKKNMRECGIVENIAPHSARKIYAVEHMKQEGLGYVQQKLQHGDMGTTLLYALSDKRLFGMNEEIIDRLYGIEQKIDLILEKICQLCE